MKLYWHPRSGGQWACATVKQAFYPEFPEPQYPGTTGHWSNRQPNAPWPGRVLSGGHGFYNGQERCIYVVRDGRDVALSFFRTKAFQHESWRGLSLSDVLRKPLDWRGTPGRRWDDGKVSIVEHWYRHVRGWEAHDDIYYLRYEDLMTRPSATLAQLGDWLGIEPQPASVNDGVGAFPSGDYCVAKWDDAYSDDDLKYFHSIVPRGFWALWREDWPDVDVVVVSYNTLGYLQGVIDDLRQTAPDANLIVVDNDSKDGSAEWLAKQADLDVVCNTDNRGYAPACNQGAVRGDAEIVIFCNTDLGLPGGWLEAVLAAFDDPEVLVAGPKSRRLNGVIRSHIIVSGCCMAVRRDWFEETGGMDDSLIFGYDDIDMSHRACIDGKTEIVDFVILHVGAASGERKDRISLIEHSREAYMTKWHQPYLRYTRTDGGHIIGVPKHDLTRGEVMRAKEKQGVELQQLLDFGYEFIEETPLERARQVNEEGEDIQAAEEAIAEFEAGETEGWEDVKANVLGDAKDEDDDGPAEAEVPGWVEGALGRAGLTIEAAREMTMDELVAYDGIGEATARAVLGVEEA